MTTKRRTNKAKLSILDYIDAIYIPDKRKKGVDLTRRSRGFYRSVAIQLSDVEGRTLRCGDVDDATLARYENWMLERAYSQHMVRNRVQAARSVVRHCFPERWPIEGRRPCLSWHETDVDGTLEQIFVDEYLPTRTRIGSVQTVRQYGRCLRLFGEYLERPAVLSDLTDRNVGAFLRWLVTSGDVKPVTANGYVKQIKALWTWAAKRRLVEHFPTIDKLPVARVVPIAWLDDELSKLIAAALATPGTVGGVQVAALWLAFHHVLWDSGERTGAMLELRWDWLDWKTGYLTVPGEFRKGRQVPMVYPLKTETLAALRAIQEPKRELMFDLLMPRDRFYKLYKKLVESAGLLYVPRKCGPQKMRRTYASRIEGAGGNATRALKHVDRRVTEDSYIDPRIAETHHENERLGPLVSASRAKGGAL